MLATIRDFFAARHVLEVETPLLCSHGTTEPAIEPFSVTAGSAVPSRRFLQTSPEYAMKRMLAAGSGPVYQIAKAFRDGEVGRRHNPEFTLLEWYRPGYDHHQLMAELAELVLACCGSRPVTYTSYRELFVQHLALDPLVAATAELEARVRAELDVGELVADRDIWLDLLMSHIIEPRLPSGGLAFIYDYPPTQASLARLGKSDGEVVAHRFELYIDGIELANGYWELTDAQEQRQRFLADNARRRERDLPEYPIDEYLLSALEAGMPDCAGVAMGLDRLLMVNTGTDDIRRVLAFDWERS